eukprot:TRINITY_DN11231_c0_g1_i1.p1 TRINITY_DN11231_c0_g1~~TRINITY_DN11231_c0_g1_i1.p1  ORF type:complete len:401 (+),score=96.27 TRINITY_DN11231_c0_g1_i1:96-1205(+)
MEKQTFLTETHLESRSGDGPTPAPSGAQQPLPQPTYPHRPVRNIYEFPSVQSLKCECAQAKHGDARLRVPWRFQRGDLGDGLRQGPPRMGLAHRRPAPEGNANTRQRNVVWHGAASLLNAAAAEGAKRAQKQPLLPPVAAPSAPQSEAAAPPFTPTAPGDSAHSTAPASSASCTPLRSSGRRSSAAAAQQMRHQVSVCGPPASAARSNSRRALSSSACCSCDATPPSPAPAAPRPTHLDAEAVGGRFLLGSLGPPPPGAPSPLPSLPPASEVAGSSAAAYENMTSVSQRTPQMSTASTRSQYPQHHHSHASRRQAGIVALEEGLRQEVVQKQRVEQALQELKQRQEKLLAQLLPGEREQLAQLKRGAAP